MNEEKHKHLANGVHKVNTAIDWISVVLVFAFPVVTGLIFYSVLFMGGAPGWFFVILGLIFAGSLLQAIYYVVVILIRLFRRRNEPDREGDRR